MSKLNKNDREALKLWQQEIEAIRNAADIDTSDSAVTIAARKKRLEANHEEWFKYYFEQYYTSEPAPFHLKATKRLMDNDRLYEVRAWSRELAKSGRAMMEVVKLVLTGKIKNVGLRVKNTPEMGLKTS